MPTEKYDEVKNFLISMKTALQKSTNLDPRLSFSTVRIKNMEALAELDIRVSDVEGVLMSLVPSDYCEGPLADSKIFGDLWVFGKMVNNKEVYIKLKLSGDAKRYLVRVISFHLPDKPMKYQF